MANKTTTKPNIWLLIVVPVAVFVITNPISWLLGRYWESYDGRIRHLTYILRSSDSILPVEKVGTDDVVVTVDGAPVENVSTTSVAIFNVTDKDYEKVHIVLEFSLQGNQPIRLLSESGGTDLNGVSRLSHAASNDIRSESIRSDDRTDLQNRPTEVLDGMKFEYEVDVANRSSEAFFYTEFVFDSAESPDVTVSVIKKGVQVREYTPSSTEADPKRVGLAELLGTVASFLTSIVVIITCAIVFKYRRLIGTDSESQDSLQVISKPEDLSSIKKKSKRPLAE